VKSEKAAGRRDTGVAARSSSSAHDGIGDCKSTDIMQSHVGSQEPHEHNQAVLHQNMLLQQLSYCASKAPI
jgi:hypothetical protein